MSSMRERIFEILDTTNLSNPHVIAEKLIADLDADGYSDVLTEVLPVFVRWTIGRHRETKQPSTIKGAVPDPLTSAASSRSLRWESYATIFRHRHAGVDGEKMLGEFVRADIEFRIADHQRSIDGHTESRKRWKALLAELDRAKKRRVDQLRPAVVEEIFG